VCYYQVSGHGSFLQYLVIIMGQIIKSVKFTEINTMCWFKDIVTVLFILLS